MSEIADNIYSHLLELFPNYNVIREHYINYGKTRLFFDFYIKELSILIEVQGRQHFEFIEHFHCDRAGFLKARDRDNMKISYVYENKKLSLVRFYYNEKITRELVLDKLNEALDHKDGIV